MPEAELADAPEIDLRGAAGDIDAGFPMDPELPPEAFEAGSGDAEAAEASLGAIPSCARQLYLKTGAADPSAAILCGSAHPARLLRLPNKGRLTAGADADLLLLDPDDLSVKACYVAGQLAWSHPNLRGALWFHA